jgi:kynureninase
MTAEGTPGPSRADALAWDEADPLASFRDRFCLGDDDLIYLDGNSLGRPPRAARDRIEEVVTAGWAGQLARAWPSWIDWNQRLGNILAAHVLGGAEGEVVLSDSTSVNLYKLAGAAISDAPGRTVLVYDGADFPTNRYIMQGLAAARGLQTRELLPDTGSDPLGRLAAALGDDVALVTLSLVNFCSGARLDMAQVNELARQSGTRVLWDLSHAAGVVPVRLAADQAELAVGCTYKYLNGGPGAPAFLYVRNDLQARLRQPIWGWFGQREQFVMAPGHDPVDGIDRFQVGTPPILSLAAAEAGLELCAEAGLEEIRRKSVDLCELMIALADRWLASRGLIVASPREAVHRGGHVALRGPDTWPLCQALAAAGVVGDFRPPDVLRLAPTPLDTRFVDVWDAMDRIRVILDQGDYRRLPRTPARVT